MNLVTNQKMFSMKHSKKTILFYITIIKYRCLILNHTNNCFNDIHVD